MVGEFRRHNHNNNNNHSNHNKEYMISFTLLLQREYRIDEWASVSVRAKTEKEAYLLLEKLYPGWIILP